MAVGTAFPRARAAAADAQRRLASAASPVVARVGLRLEPVVDAIRKVVEPITHLGWMVAAMGVLVWWIGQRLGWDELMIVAVACLALVVISLAATVGRLGVDLETTVLPDRVVVGNEAVGQVTVTNSGPRAVFGARIEVPVGANIHPFEVGGLKAGEAHLESFVVPTSRRAIIPIGPAASVKGDPLGVARREVVSGTGTVLFVRPFTRRLPSFTAGWLRDLDGRTSNDLSTSDVAFHTLREYVPGDDRRHIHWKTTARIGQLMIRQFVDTRRSHLGLILSTTASDWAGDDEFELGVSVVGSLGRTTLMDGQEVTMVGGRQPMPAHTAGLLLDGLAGIDVGPGPDVHGLAQWSKQFVRGASIIAVVVGSQVDNRSLRAACDWLGHERTILAIRCRLGEAATRRRVGNVSIVELGVLEDLDRILGVVGAA